MSEIVGAEISRPRVAFVIEGVGEAKGEFGKGDGSDDDQEEMEVDEDAGEEGLVKL